MNEKLNSEERRLAKLNGAIKSGEISKEKARKRREEYNLNSTLRCLNCSSPLLFNLIDNFEEFNKIRLRKFCNKSCAAKYNNKIRWNSVPLKSICSCGSKKYYTAQCCNKCKIQNSLQRVLDTPIYKYFSKGNARIKFVQIRSWARIILKRSKRKKTCEFCNSSEFDEIVQVCHVVEISSFPDNALMGEVNSLSNLKYLCPNHHKLLDKKIIDVNGKKR